jgi:DNA-3-methyladenine glycosylase II
MADFVLAPRGPFTLASAARFIAGWAPTARASAVSDAPEVHLGFLSDDWSGHAGVVLTQDGDGRVRGEIVDGDATDPQRVAAQAARIVSLDHDGTAWAELGERDAVLGPLQQASGFLRPVLFHSPYEAACWAVISTRVRQPQAAKVRDALSAAHGAQLRVGDEDLLGFPAPERLLAVSDAPGITPEKLARLHAIAHAALEGRLDRDALLSADPAMAVAALRELPGIGPFWADGILLRAVGPMDVPTAGEPRVRAHAAARYGVPEAEASETAFLALAERWRPCRTWASVLLRASGPAPSSPAARPA